MRYTFFAFFLTLSWSVVAQSSNPVPLKISVRPAPLSISGPTVICEGGEAILKVEGDFESFSWNTGGNDRFLKVKEAGVYEVTVKTKGGCSLTSSVVVRTRPCS
jgi:hypothetical protein